MTEDDWLDPEFAEEDGDVCHHGVGFDTDCGWCDQETAEELAAERRARAEPPRQATLPFEEPR